MSKFQTKLSPLKGKTWNNEAEKGMREAKEEEESLKRAKEAKRRRSKVFFLGILRENSLNSNPFTHAELMLH